MSGVKIGITKLIHHPLKLIRLVLYLALAAWFGVAGGDTSMGTIV